MFDTLSSSLIELQSLAIILLTPIYAAVIDTIPVRALERRLIIIIPSFPNAGIDISGSGLYLCNFCNIQCLFLLPTILKLPLKKVGALAPNCHPPFKSALKYVPLLLDLLVEPKVSGGPDTHVRTGLTVALEIRRQEFQLMGWRKFCFILNFMTFRAIGLDYR